ncbi:hypothetical protein [Kingella potus]|uniref:hypothetical protein n=1 Tax=Kingella potus TaxID=265175 RepID=UPI001FD6221B|nr:hypothetical protein [Kingella potus]UOP01616.1 hypothetical protein LVJ84_05485 [Kingella potus]
MLRLCLRPSEKCFSDGLFTKCGYAALYAVLCGSLFGQWQQDRPSENGYVVFRRPLYGSNR